MLPAPREVCLPPRSARAEACLFVDLSVRFGGASMRVLQLLQDLPRGRCAVAVVDDSPVARQATAMGLRALAVGTSRADPRIVGRLARGIREGGFRLVDAQNPQSMLWGALAARRAGAACVATYNSWPADEYAGNPRGPLYGALYRALAPLIHRHVAVSTAILERLLARGLAAGNCALIHNAAPAPASPVVPDRARLLETLGLAPDAQLCCAVGRVVPSKGHDVLVAAMRRLATRHPRLHCLIVGDGAIRGRLAADVEASGLRGRVLFLGEVPPERVLSIVSSCDVFAMPSRSEGTPLALLEAAALSRPVVASRVGGIPDVVVDGVHGRLVEPGDAPALALAIEGCLLAPDTAASMAEACRQRLERDFSRAGQLRGVVDAHRRALQAHAREAAARRPGRR